MQSTSGAGCKGTGGGLPVVCLGCRAPPDDYVRLVESDVVLLFESQPAQHDREDEASATRDVRDGFHVEEDAIRVPDRACDVGLVACVGGGGEDQLLAEVAGEAEAVEATVAELRFERKVLPFWPDEEGKLRRDGVRIHAAPGLDQQPLI